LVHEFREERLDRRKEVVIDFGFGNGNALFWFRPPSKIFGLEISEEAVKAARRRALRRKFRDFDFINLRALDSVSIPFPDGVFSVVICSHTIEHVYSDERLIKELYRVCRPGGKAFMAVPLDCKEEKKLLSHAERVNPDFPAKSFHVYRYNLKSFRFLVRKVGFKVLRSYSADAVMDFAGKNLRGQLPIRMFLSCIPFRGWFFLDQFLRERGFRFRQGIIVAER
jgi:SAM-dependent methyltransferase